MEGDITDIILNMNGSDYLCVTSLISIALKQNNNNRDEALRWIDRVLAKYYGYNMLLRQTIIAIASEMNMMRKIEDDVGFRRYSLEMDNCSFAMLLNNKIREYISNSYLYPNIFKSLCSSFGRIVNVVCNRYDL